MVAAKIANLPAHRPAHNPASLPTSASISQPQAASMLNVSERKCLAWAAPHQRRQTQGRPHAAAGRRMGEGGTIEKSPGDAGWDNSFVSKLRKELSVDEQQIATPRLVERGGTVYEQKARAPKPRADDEVVPRPQAPEVRPSSEPASPAMALPIWGSSPDRIAPRRACLHSSAHFNPCNQLRKCAAFSIAPRSRSKGCRRRCFAKRR